MNGDHQIVLDVRGLSKSFRRGGHELVALRDIGFSLSTGETLALVGPSGSGKSTLARLVTRLLPPDSGEIIFGGRDFLRMKGAELRGTRRDLQLVFQDPLASFNPRATVEQVVEDPLRIHRIVPRRDRVAAIDDLLVRVGLEPALRGRRVHEISGGQRQRVAIARAIATRPKVIVLDEALSALDVTIRWQVVELLKSLQTNDNIAYLFISHDLSLVRSLAHRVAVLDAGRIVEIGRADEVISGPKSAMGQALVSAIPKLFDNLKE